MRYWLINLLTLSLTSASIDTFAQFVVTQNEQGRLVTTSRSFYTGRYVSMHTRQYVGSPYLGEAKWHPGRLIYPTGQQQSVLLSLNLLTNEFACQLRDSTQVSLNTIDEFYFEDKRFIVDPPHPSGLGQPTYYEVLADGPIKLLKRYHQQVKPLGQGGIPNGQRAGGTSDTFGMDGVIITTVGYYSQQANESPHLVVPTKKRLLKSFPAPQPAAYLFPEVKHLNESELISFFHAYNQAANSY